MLKASGVEVLRLPGRSPNLNSYTERFVLSANSECLRRIVPLTERHLRRTMSAFVSHYHGERHHQGLGGSLIIANDNTERAEGDVQCRERLGGMLKFTTGTRPDGG